jgi:hypothetical protein
MLLMFFHLHDTSERDRVCSRAASCSWRRRLLLI